MLPKKVIEDMEDMDICIIGMMRKNSLCIFAMEKIKMKA
jgi:hypothetical protein